MTEQEFWENVDTWDELIDICYEYNCYACDEIFSEEARDEYIEDYIANTGDYWDEIRDYLNGIPTGYDRYYRNDFGGWYGTYDGDDIFNESKDEVGEWLAENEQFDVEEIEEDDFSVYEDPRDAYIPEINAEDIPEIYSIIDFCSENIGVVRNEDIEDDKPQFKEDFADEDEACDELDFEEFNVERLLEVV